MQTRRLGRTGHQSTVVVFGGAALGRVSQQEAFQALDTMLAAGVNHIDIAPSYGSAETLTGPWLEQHRDKFFLACKTGERSREGARAELEKSLRLLHTDKLELHQLHAVTTFADLHLAMGPGGAIETLKDARDRGLTRWLGITGHGLDAPAIQLEALERFDFDTVMFPINPVLYANASYRADAERLLQVCADRDVGVHLIKSVAKGPWGTQERTHHTWYEPYSRAEKIQQGVDFALSVCESAVIPAAGDIHLLPLVLKAAENYRLLSQSDQEALILQAEELEPLFV
jgi:aryl-alcohol dehydrogenase-like predicted oxidoreductase